MPLRAILGSFPFPLPKPLLCMLGLARLEPQPSHIRTILIHLVLDRHPSCDSSRLHNSAPIGTASLPLGLGLQPSAPAPAQRPTKT